MEHPDSVFREYDIRGVVDKELNEAVVRKIGYYLTKSVLCENPDARYIAVGYDARLHSERLFSWLAAGINRAGLSVLDMGLVPTPVNYFANYTEFDGRRCDASVMITGSHNPPEYNGFKITVGKAPFFGEQIYRLGEEVKRGIVPEGDAEAVIPIDAKARYIRYMIEQFRGLQCTGRRFVFDCGNGAAGVVLRPILEGLGIEADYLFEEPDGNFPNHHPDPSDIRTLEDLRGRLRTGDYTLGFAYDGDADRLAVLSERYNFKGDILAIFFARHMENPLVIGEVKCSQVMYDTIRTYGRVRMYKTGHSNLKVKIRETGASLAAEVSGHLFFNDRYFGYDDAIYATLRVLELIDRGDDLDAAYEALPSVYTTEEITLETTESEKFLRIARLKEKLATPPEGFPEIREVIDVDGVRVIFDEGWGLVRASNTTPKLVTRFEAKDRETAERYREALLGLLE